MYRKEKQKRWKAGWTGKKARRIAGNKVDNNQIQLKHGYAAYFAKLQEEIKRDAARADFLEVLKAITDKKSEMLWQEEKPVLENLQKELIALGKIPSPNQTENVIKYCISMFDIISRAQDELIGKIICVPKDDDSVEKEEVLKQFNNDLYYLGRHASDDLREDSVYGKVPYWNTTKKGEPINIDTIKFGMELGEMPRPARYWLKLSKSQKVKYCKPMEFEKGRLIKPILMWKTAALVRIGIYTVCQKGVKLLLEELEILLS